MWCSTPAKGDISAARRDRPAARGSPPCQTTEKRGASGTQAFTDSATDAATSTGIVRSTARNGR
jgi:hypothetical protein